MRYTAYVSWGLNGADGIEEIDVEAEDETAAKKELANVLKAEYTPGGKLMAIEPRCPGITYF